MKPDERNAMKRKAKPQRNGWTARSGALPTLAVAILAALGIAGCSSEKSAPSADSSVESSAAQANESETATGEMADAEAPSKGMEPTAANSSTENKGAAADRAPARPAMTAPTPIMEPKAREEALKKEAAKPKPSAPTGAAIKRAEANSEMQNSLTRQRSKSMPMPMAPAASPIQRVAVDPQTLPSREEEIWVISKSDATETPVASFDNDLPICSMRAKQTEDGELIPMPLKHTKVDASIKGYLATVDVTQQFHNPFNSKIEAVYVFPLPQNSAVNEFVMTIGDRKIRGIIREKEEAKQIYEAAKRGGYKASLLTQNRPNVFTQKVANIEPGKQIDINLKYYNTLAWRDGWYEFAFPMVVGPRFNPAGSTAGVGAVPRGAHGKSGQSTEAQYLRPKERAGHDIALNVKLDAGVEIEELVSRTHAIGKVRKSASQFQIALKDLDRIPNKDFVMRFRVAGSRVKSNLFTHRDERGGYFSLMLYPPDSMKSLQRKPMEMIFVIDCSGSMNGAPIQQAKAAIKRALNHLEADDTFQIIRFSNNSSQLGPKPRPATAANVRLATEYLESLRGSGGTQMIEGLKAALDFPHDPRRLRFVTFLTDGLIGNEADILSAIHERLGATRIFSFGVGSSPNDYLMDRMAKMGRGAVAYLNLTDSATDVMDRFFERVSHPALTDITIDWGGMMVEEVYPSRPADLFVGRPLVLTGKFQGEGAHQVRVRGNLGNGEEIAFRIPVNLNSPDSPHRGLAAVWARRKISDMADRAAYVPNLRLQDSIKELALNYSLMSSYTAFVAVDSSARTAGNVGTTVPVAVPTPEGMKYETSVGN